MVFACDTSGGDEHYSGTNLRMIYTAASGYNASQIAGVVIDYRGRVDTGISDLIGRPYGPALPTAGSYFPSPTR